jgi:tetratricopeptide (TPR) repeat protein
MLRLFFVPAGFSVDHAATVPSIAKGLLAMLLCAAIVVAALRLARRPATAAIGAGILVAAASSLVYWVVPLPDLMSERRAYLPMIGAALALAGAVGPFLDRQGLLPRQNKPRPPLPAFVIAALRPLLFARARLWGDPRLLWEEAARLGPSLARPLINLGVMAAERGDRGAAADLFDRAIALEPRNAEALFNRARLRLDAGRVEQAIADLEMAVAVAPAMPRAWINLGIARIRRNDLAGAEEALLAALAIDPGDPRALTNLAEVLRATDRAPEALPLYREALAADPAYAHAAVRLGVALESLGDRPGALTAYRDYLRRGPASPADRDAVLRKIDALRAGDPAR